MKVGNRVRVSNKGKTVLSFRKFLIDDVKGTIIGRGAENTIKVHIDGGSIETAKAIAYHQDFWEIIPEDEKG